VLFQSKEPKRHCCGIVREELSQTSTKMSPSRKTGPKECKKHSPRHVPKDLIYVSAQKMPYAAEMPNTIASMDQELHGLLDRSPARPLSGIESLLLLLGREHAELSCDAGEPPSPSSPSTFTQIEPHTKGQVVPLEPRR